MQKQGGTFQASCSHCFPLRYFHVAEGERSQKQYPNKPSMCTALHRLYIAWLYIGWHIKILVPGVGYFLSCWSGLPQIPPKQIQSMVVVLDCPQELDGKAPIAGWASGTLFIIIVYLFVYFLDFFLED